MDGVQREAWPFDPQATSDLLLAVLLQQRMLLENAGEAGRNTAERERERVVDGWTDGMNVETADMTVHAMSPRCGGSGRRCAAEGTGGWVARVGALCTQLHTTLPSLFLCVADFGVEIESSKLAVDGLGFYCFLKTKHKGCFH